MVSAYLLPEGEVPADPLEHLRFDPARAQAEFDANQARIAALEHSP